MIASCNVRSLNASEKQRDVALFVKNNKVGLFGLLETKLTKSKVDSCHKKLFLGFEALDTCIWHPKCRVWLLWDPCSFDIVSSMIEDSFIHVLVRHKRLMTEIWVTMVYAPNDYADRLVLWNKLVSLKPTVAGPWLVLGDFNNVLHFGERTGAQLVSTNETMPFKTCLEDCELEDMRSKGRFFTWNNGTVYSKIDRALVNGDWMALFPAVEACFSQERLSDHTPIVIDLIQRASLSKPQFRFLNMWAQLDSFATIVQSIWGRKVHGTKQFVLMSKLHSWQQPLRALHRNSFPDVVHHE